MEEQNLSVLPVCAPFYLANLLTPKWWCFHLVMFFILTAHHPNASNCGWHWLIQCSFKQDRNKSSPKHFKNQIIASTFDWLPLVWCSNLWGIKNPSFGQYYILHSHHWTLFRLCGWRSYRLILRLHHKCTPHACTEYFIRPKVASVSWLKVDGQLGVWPGVRGISRAPVGLQLQPGLLIPD